MTPFILCRGLAKAFGRHPVLRDLSLEVREGETLVILGGSGVGKSVLLKLMNGLLKPDAGRVMVEGEEITAMTEDALVPVRKKVAMLFQGGALFDSLTVEENIAFPLREHTSLPPSAVRDRVRQVLSLVDLSGSEHLFPAQLSGGMRKRAALARALALEPRAVLYDEPTTGLDPVVAAKINALIGDLQHKLRLTSVVVTHDLHSAFLVGDRLAFLDDGEIRFIGTRQEMEQAADLSLRQFLAAAS